ncbi:DNA mismatch repair protein MutT [Candidatus Saccharibacteria bacterium]|nr:DNA mismatch repair protein MutT [Candidatus Saccharibacteria bacterium]
MKISKQYVPPTLTVDMVIFQIIDGHLQVLLTQRARPPFKDVWALPGGYSGVGYTTLESTTAVVKRKAGVDINQQLAHVEQLHTFDTVARDPRGHAVAVVYSGYGQDIKPVNPLQKTKFFDVDGLPEIAFDHKDIINHARDRLRTRLAYTNVTAAFLPSRFTLTDLQTVYEAILSRKLDRRNFRRHITSLDMVHDTGHVKTSGAHRPAKLYAYNSLSIGVIKSRLL